MLFSDEIRDFLSINIFSKKTFQEVYPFDYIKKMKKPSKKNNNKLYIYNRDTSDMIGSHWIAVFLTKYSAEIFDPLSLNPEEYKNITQYLLSKLKYNKILYCKNAVQHILADTCGYHVIYFGVLRSQGYTFKDIVKYFYTTNKKKNDIIVKIITKNNLI